MEECNMSRGRTPSGDYTGCIPTMIPIPKDLHQALKVQCVKEGTTMKEVLHELNIKAIQEKLS